MQNTPKTTKIQVCLHSNQGICNGCLTGCSMPVFKVVEKEIISEYPQCKKCVLLKTNCEYHKL